MANIFSGTEPPSWLTGLTKDNERKFAQIGQEVGTNIGAGLLAMTQRDQYAKPDPETGEQPKLSFNRAWQEARLNQTDPMWKLKAEQAKAEVASRMAQATTANALAQAKVDESKAWMEDVPELAKWRQNQDYVPTLRSELGNKFYQEGERYSGANQIYRDGAKAWSSMLNNLSKRGGQYAVLAGEFAGTHGRIPSDAEKAAFGERLSKLGMSEQELLAEVGPPTSAKTGGTGGPQFNYNGPELKAKTDQQTSANASREKVAEMNLNARLKIAEENAKAEKEAATLKFERDKILAELRSRYQSAAEAVAADNRLNTEYVRAKEKLLLQAEDEALLNPRQQVIQEKAKKAAQEYKDAVEAAKSAIKATAPPPVPPRPTTKDPLGLFN